jgi:hypothetical protein
VTVTISTPGQVPSVSWTGSAGDRVFLNITNVSLSPSCCENVTIVKPDGTQLANQGSISNGGSAYIDTRTLPTSGTYTITVAASNNATGSTTLSFYSVPADATGTISEGGPPVTVATTAIGQNAALTFSGTAGDRVFLNITNVSLPACCENVTIVKPDGIQLANQGSINNGELAYIDTRTLPTTGTYQITVNPGGTIASSSTTLTLYSVPPDATGAISEGGPPVTIATGAIGQNAALTFSGTAGDRVFLNITNVTLPACCENVTIVKPDGNQLANQGSINNGESAYIDTKTLPTTGTYKITVDPGGTITSSSTTLTLYNVPADAAGSLALDGDAVLVTLAVPGQNGQLSFAGTAGQQVTLDRGGVTIPNSTVKILNPNGSVLWNSGLVGTGDATNSVQLGVSGTFTVAIDGWGTSIGDMTVSLSSEPTPTGGLEHDQSSEAGDDTPFSPATPQAMSPTGIAPGGSYSTDLWPGDATGTSDGLYVVSSTASGTTALSGVVRDDSTGSPVAGAAVTLTYQSCAPTCSGVPTTTTTDEQGSFAFVNMPATTDDLTVGSNGYGLYSVVNDPYAADTPYETTVSLTAASQTIDMAGGAGTIADNSNFDTSLPGTAYSQRRVPPSIRVELLNTYPRSAGQQFCQASGGPQNPPVVNYSFDFYILHVVEPEVGGLNYNQIGMKAFMAIAQNFAWFHKTKQGSYDVTNASNISQCFQPKEKVSVSQWNAWIQDVLDERIADSSDNLRETQYASGTAPGSCDDPADPAHNGTQASQYGIKAHSEPTEPAYPYASCQMSDWRDLAVYYYPTTWHVVSGLKPMLPKTSYSVSGGQITLNFNSQIYGANVAWRFYLQRLSGGSWRTFQTVKWSHASRSIPQSYTFTPSDSSCTRYRVKAWNPAGASQASVFTPLGIGLSQSGTCNL